MIENWYKVTSNKNNIIKLPLTFSYGLINMFSYCYFC